MLLAVRSTKPILYHEIRLNAVAALTCAACSAVNFARRVECYQCSSVRPANPQRVPLDQVWIHTSVGMQVWEHKCGYISLGAQ